MDNARSRIRCRCRRGVRELDLLFERYLQQGFGRLPDTELVVFERLLEQPDLDIIDWLTGKRRADDEALWAMCVRIREQLGI